MSSKLDRILDYLRSLSAPVDLEILGQLLREGDFSLKDIASEVKFSENTYHRNSIAKTAWFEALVMGWRPGQFTKIHDHAGSSCGFKIVSGTATEQRYALTGAQGKDLPLVHPTTHRTYHAGDCCLAFDREIHRISNESAAENLVTLHIYSPPLAMNYYETEALPSGAAAAKNAEVRR